MLELSVCADMSPPVKDAHVSAARQHIAALDPESLRAIERGAHAAPFNVLGVQRTDAGRLLRVNAPGAWRVEARARRDRSVLAVLDQSQTPGLFAAPFEDEAPYVLRIYWPGGVEEREDPYSFPPTISHDELARLRDGRFPGASGVLGARPALLDGVQGVRFALWAPQAASVAIAGDFNDWSERRHPMRRREEAGVWELFIPRVHAGARYAFAVRDGDKDGCTLMADPLARALERAPRVASIVESGPAHAWRDERFLAIRRARRDCAPPTAIYRLEPFAWQKQDGDGAAQWRTLGERLPSYVSALGFTHVQIARPAGPSPAWLFAPPPEHGGGDEFAAFVDSCHEAGLGVIIEWDAPDAFAGLASEWDALARNILADSAMHWLETCHLDGLSIAAAHADQELLARIHARIDARAPGALLIVEAGDTQHGAPPIAHLWRNDMMAVALGAAPAPLVGQSAAQLEGALLAVTPRALADLGLAGGDALARLRGAYALAWLTPGAKLMHMGAELGQHAWPSGAVDWDILEAQPGPGFLKLVRDLNHTLRNEAPLRLTARVTQQMIWPRIEAQSHGAAPCIAYVRTGEAAAPLLVAQNRTGDPLSVSVDVPCGGFWRELLNTDSRHYGGGDVGNYGGAHAGPEPREDGTFRLDIVLPQWGAVIFRNDS